MSGPYTMPSASMPPYTHMHSGSHSHHHGHSQSQSSINSWKTAGSNGGLHSHPEDGDYSEDGSTYGHQHTHSHSRGRTNSQLSTGSSMLSRERPIPAPLDSLGGWTEEKTLGGKGVLTPGFDMTPMPLHTPTQSFHDAHDGANHAHNHSHGHIHAHSHEHSHHHEHSHAHDDLDHHDHHGHGHGHGHHHHHGHVHTHTHDSSAERSFFTNSLLPYTARYPILHAIMTEKDSRRIFYFMSLNFSFMAVQAFYGYVTDSLGLLSDSVHMFFDCVALLVGLLAAVMSKWPPSQRFPFGFGKIETLSGFANGILLMLLSVEIAFEAFERLWEGTHTKRLGELFIVSSLGLLVNLVGMMAFGHHHHGHDHGGHGHSHGDHSHDDHGHSHHHHDHAHDNENMHGIYLHVLADTLGSVSVIVSTVLTSIWGWAGWDPLASCLIAGLIFLSSKPLVYSSARRLLLNVPEATEYNLRNSLGGILQQRGVVGYTTPKFWMDDRNGSDGSAKLVGVVHVVAGRGSGLDEVRDRVREYLLQEGIDAVVQVEREGDNSCWCSRARGATMPQTPKPF